MNLSLTWLALFSILGMLLLGSPSLLAQMSTTNSEPLTHPTFSPEFLEKIKLEYSFRGFKNGIAEMVTDKLGLTSGVMWKCDEIYTKDDKTSFVRTFSSNPGTVQDIVLTLNSITNIDFYWAHRDGTLLSALSFNVQKQQFTTLSLNEAQTDFVAEVLWWNSNIDDISASDFVNPK